MKIHHIIEQTLEEGPNDPHIFKAVFLAGGPGSGKTFVANKMLSGTGLRPINSDEVYEYLMTKQGLEMDPEVISSPQGQEIRDKAKDISRNRERHYLDGRIGLIIDGTGKNIEKYATMVNKLKAIGYEVAMLYVNTSLEVAQQRNLERKRSLQPAMVKSMWNEVQNNMMQFQQIFGAQNFLIVDNSGGLEDPQRSKNFNVVDKELRKFLNSEPSHPKAVKWVANQSKR
jgi:predicted kinase